MCNEERQSEEETLPDEKEEHSAAASPDEGEDSGAARFVKVDDKKPEGYDGSCLRPTGMCDLGGCCDVCWYSPEHPRFSKK